MVELHGTLEVAAWKKHVSLLLTAHFYYLDQMSSPSSFPTASHISGCPSPRHALNGTVSYVSSSMLFPLPGEPSLY